MNTDTETDYKPRESQPRNAPTSLTPVPWLPQYCPANALRTTGARPAPGPPPEPGKALLGACSRAFPRPQCRGKQRPAPRDGAPGLLDWRPATGEMALRKPAEHRHQPPVPASRSGPSLAPVVSSFAQRLRRKAACPPRSVYVRIRRFQGSDLFRLSLNATSVPIGGVNMNRQMPGKRRTTCRNRAFSFDHL